MQEYIERSNEWFFLLSPLRYIELSDNFVQKSQPD